MMRPNEKVFWNSRKPDRTGNTLRPAKVIQRNGHTYRILFLEKRLFESSYGPVVRWVHSTTLSPRILPLALLNETMSISYHGFKLTFKRQPTVIPSEGAIEMYSAVIDDYEIGSQTDSEEAAVALAYKCLTEGGYESALRSSLKIYQAWLAEGVEAANKVIAEKGVMEINRKLKKIESFNKVFSEDAGRVAAVS